MEETKWQLVKPEGVVNLESFDVNPHFQNLDAKTVLLRWNGKHNGDVFLNRIAELLKKSVKGIKIIKSWEFAPETAMVSHSPQTSKEWARKFADTQPDIVIGSTGD